MLKWSNRILVLLFITFLLSFNIFNLFVPDRAFSDFENRVLAQSPKFTFKNLVSGKYTSQFEEYISDQFILRDFWVAMKSDLERLSYKTENNGVFFGKEGYLLEDYKKPDQALIKNVERINAFAARLNNIPVSLLLAPNSVKIYEDKLPHYATPYNQLDTLSQVEEHLDAKVNFINVVPTLIDHKDQYLYFKTDHHWTMRGAFYAYQQLMASIGETPYAMDDFHNEFVDDSFYGTYYSKANNKHLAPDAIEIFTPTFDVAYEVSYKDTDESSHSLYEYGHLNKRDKYPVFLDGNHALLTIKTSVANHKKLIIFKDSYAHCLIPFLANHYEEIHVLDLRYYKLNVYDYIKEHDINEALFLHNVSTFSTPINLP